MFKYKRYIAGIFTFALALMILLNWEYYIAPYENNEAFVHIFLIISFIDSGYKLCFKSKDVGTLEILDTISTSLTVIGISMWIFWSVVNFFGYIIYVINPTYNYFKNINYFVFSVISLFLLIRLKRSIDYFFNQNIK